MLDDYSTDLIDEANRIVMPAIVVAYSLYAVLGAAATR